MKQPEYILQNLTRIRTHEHLGETAGFFITKRHLDQRKAGAVGAICGIVGGHGGDVYYVAHIGDTAMAAYCWDEFELEPAPEPQCPECKGTGIDFPASHKLSLGTPCSWCKGSGSAEPMHRPTAWERIQEDFT